MLKFGEEDRENGQPPDCCTERTKMLDMAISGKQDQFSSPIGRDGGLGSDTLLPRPAICAYCHRCRRQGLFARIRYFPTFFSGIGDKTKLVPISEFLLTFF